MLEHFQRHGLVVFVCFSSRYIITEMCMVDWTKALEGRLAMIVRLRGTGTAIQVGHSEASKCMNQPEPRPYLKRRVAKTEHIKFYINVCPLVNEFHSIRSLRTTTRESAGCEVPFP